MLSECVRNITAFCQLILRPIISAVLADTDISVKPIYRSISRHQHTTDDGGQAMGEELIHVQMSRQSKHTRERSEQQ